ncbi:MAG: zinc ribbon domain-containing protein [Anaerolineae bacterium]|nr:zinc ribbon domain-containing protein [Anaerolineae bacterium]
MWWTWLVVGLMFVGVVAALGYPLLRPRSRGASLRGDVEDLDAWIEEAVQARRRKPAAAAATKATGAARACPNCGTRARAGDRFCRQCGTSLALACPHCGAPYEEGDRFCVQCGKPLAGEVNG